MSYFNVEELDSSVQLLAKQYGEFCTEVNLPNTSVENRNIRSLVIGANRNDTNFTAVFFLGGMHAREWMPPDAILYMCADLLEALDKKTGLRYGNAYLTYDELFYIYENLNIIALPCANPDGRAYSQTIDPNWRKNRKPLIGDNNQVCYGVDLNRNFDILWDFETYFADGYVSASNNPCDYNIYVGQQTESEPETRNVVHMFDNYPAIKGFIDIHSSVPAIFHCWGIEENQSADHTQNFRNATFDGLRGMAGDHQYAEYIDPDDRKEIIQISELIANEVKQVSGDTYEVSQAFSLYATSGASDDFAYSRHLTNPSNNQKTLGFTMECGHDFQPDWKIATTVFMEVSASLLRYALYAAKPIA